MVVNYDLLRAALSLFIANVPELERWVFHE
jgi:hypothetical protein